MTVENPEFKPNLREKHNMKMPGFTAEASLFNSDVRYQSTAEASVYGGIVQIASPFSDVFDPDRLVPLLSAQLFDPNRPIFYLKFQPVESLIPLS
jgi:hypothetical protein